MKTNTVLPSMKQTHNPIPRAVPQPPNLPPMQETGLWKAIFGAAEIRAAIIVGVETANTEHCLRVPGVPSRAGMTPMQEGETTVMEGNLTLGEET